MQQTVYQAISHLLMAIQNLQKGQPTLGNREHLISKHAKRIKELVKEYLPSGSGFDRGTAIHFDKSTPDRIVLEAAFHHMDDNGYYDGWTVHPIAVKPSLAFGIEIKVGGRNKRDIKDHIHESFHYALTRVIPEPTGPNDTGATAPAAKTAEMYWDWKEQPTAEEIQKHLNEIGAKDVHVYKHPIQDTQDQIGLIFSNQPLSEEQVAEFWPPKHLRDETDNNE